jgi:serine phosphatase RsbU (regulator of sigma subunit)
MKHEKAEAMAAQEIKHQNRIMYVMTALLLMLVVFAFIVFRHYTQKKKINSQLEHVNALIQEKNKSITDSITYAKRIQRAILPSDKSIRDQLPSSFVLLKPKDIVSGDFYWFEKTNGKVLFSAVDCTGHGVPGAMVSVVGHNNLNRCVKEFRLEKPSDILDKLNELVQETFSGSSGSHSNSGKDVDEVKDGMDLALCSLDFNTNMLEYAGANNPLWILRKGSLNNENEKIEEVKANKQPIGKYADRKPFTNHRIQLYEGDTVYIFSDGYADQFGGQKGKKFKYKKLQELLLSIQEKGIHDQEKILLDAFVIWQDQLEQVDDVLIIGVRVLAPLNRIL